VCLLYCCVTLRVPACVSMHMCECRRGPVVLCTKHVLHSDEKMPMYLTCCDFDQSNGLDNWYEMDAKLKEWNSRVSECSFCQLSLWWCILCYILTQWALCNVLIYINYRFICVEFIVLCTIKQRRVIYYVWIWRYLNNICFTSMVTTFFNLSGAILNMVCALTQSDRQTNAYREIIIIIFIVRFSHA